MGGEKVGMTNTPEGCKDATDINLNTAEKNALAVIGRAAQTARLWYVTRRMKHRIDV